MKPLCVIDLDGTLLDCAERHHRCYQESLAPLSRRVWSRADYWRMKRAGRSLAGILDSEDPVMLNAYRERWRRRIESPELLALDRPAPGAMAALQGWRGRGPLVLCTLRRDRAATLAQLRGLGLAGCFDQIIVTGGQDKARALERELAFGYSGLTWIGDSEADLEAARALRARACLVTHGIRDAECLRRHGAARDELYPALNAIDPFFIPWDGPPEIAPLSNDPGAPW